MPLFKRIFIVEDDPSTKQLLKTLLEIENFNIITPDITNIDALINSIQQNKPDYILMDVHMKNINGIDILKIIRSIKNLSFIKILITSGIDYEDECIMNGANGFMLKPYIPNELIQWFKTM